MMNTALRNGSRMRRHSAFSMYHLSLSPLPPARGFTLVETVVALAVITGALVGPFLLSSRSIFNARYAKSRLIAANLAQEGIEIIRSYRDNNVLAGDSWDAGLDDGSYRVDVICAGSPCRPAQAGSAANFASCAGSCSDLIKFDSASGIYSYSGTQETGFRRTVTIDRAPIDVGAGSRSDAGVAAEKQMFVKSVVIWTDGRVSRAMQVDEILYDWR
ncbi:MAG: hypothetical protein A3A44_00210 [Candidatus Sungbacteria bacterium RIFCSPLOWO2_01_FULL_60_25]|uniref:Prepilin-type N-terminal cleavage/methylation domain-containing protein n=1 Tax=Candidatus Sungbacteria bacterium RIFCSPLOWO2_01_FULL_60_25 TaxID=1802281 RepID=A0A1G2LC97_9BACT|nr:MAG: hypothetical protein A3A44_00210 [Candidatus Sungbacteria bacterium RIFCSPLOWO2_01_FULL_60_25]